MNEDLRDGLDEQPNQAMKLTGLRPAAYCQGVRPAENVMSATSYIFESRR